MKKVIMGNHAVSYGVMLSRVEVIAAYPITPQTPIVEELSEFCAEGKLKAKFLKVESEHSALASCIAASATGSRTFTATSSQGLALMHELLHWTSSARLPVVMAEVNRALAPGWNIWTEQTDTLSQRDTGWMQFYCESNQEILDSIIQAYKISEKVLLPSMVIYDAFFLSHTYEPVDIPAQEEVDNFLPPYQARERLDPDCPQALGTLTYPDHFMEFRERVQDSFDHALEIICQTGREFEQLFGRGYELVEAYNLKEARMVIVTTGTLSSTVRMAIDELKKRGKEVGLVRVRVFRPFPGRRMREILGGVEKVVIIDRNLSPGAGGIFAQEIKGALQGIDQTPVIFSFIGGLGGRDIRPRDIEEIIQLADREERPRRDIYWIGLKKQIPNPNWQTPNY